MNSKTIVRWYRTFMWLVAAHSFSVGMALVLLPLDFFPWFGFEGYAGTFFKIQGGVFHMVMCGAYVPAALDPVRYRIMLRFAIFAKFTATAFLLSYFVAGDPAWMVLLSGFLDFGMGIVLLWFERRLSLSAGSDH